MTKEKAIADPLPVLDQTIANLTTLRDLVSTISDLKEERGRAEFQTREVEKHLALLRSQIPGIQDRIHELEGHRVEIQKVVAALATERAGHEARIAEIRRLLAA
jgi:chromosome segregation ATPase